MFSHFPHVMTIKSSLIFVVSGELVAKKHIITERSEYLSVFNDEVFVEHLGSLLNLSLGGQVAMRGILERYLQRVDRDPSGVVERLYPFIRRQDSLDEPRVIVIDPRIAFGRAVIAGSGIPTSVIAERFKAGETVKELAEDYRRPEVEVEEAVRCELDLAA